MPAKPETIDRLPQDAIMHKYKPSGVPSGAFFSPVRREFYTRRPDGAYLVVGANRTDILLSKDPRDAKTRQISKGKLLKDLELEKQFPGKK